MFWLAVASPLVIAVVGRPLVMASVAAANVLLVDVRRLVEASAPAAATVSNPLVTDGRARPFVTDAPTKPLVNVPAAVIVSRPLVTEALTNPLVIAVVGNPLVITKVAAASVLLVLLTKAAVARAFVPVMSSFSAIAPASVLLRVSVALTVSRPLVTEIVGSPLVTDALTKPLVNAPAAVTVSR